MKNWKLPVFCLMVAVCILLNIGGRQLAAGNGLPFWLDSFGTILCAYMSGPFIGAMVGISSNLIFHMMFGANISYALISMVIALIVGFAARCKKMENLFQIMTVGAVVAIAAMASSVPLNALLNNGSTGNIWGDSVIGFLRELGTPDWFCLIIGQLYVELLDKILVMFLLFVVTRIVRKIIARNRLDPADQEEKPDAGEPEGEKPEGETAEKEKPEGKTSGTDAAETAKASARATALLLAAGLAISGLAAGSARAEAGSHDINFNDYVQSIYSSQNGLPCGEANDIAQTADGILWIGTYAGLYRYNGKEFRWMDSYDSVRNVNVLYVDEEGRLWIGTNDNGLSIVINEKVVNVLDQSTGLPSNSVRAIIRSSDGYYYIGTTGSMQVLSLNYGLKRLNTLSEIYYANNISADESGHVATVTSAGTLYLLEKGQILSSRQMTDDKTVFRSCEFDRDGRLLAATTGHEIYIFDISRGWFDQVGVLRTGDLESIKDMVRLDNGTLLITADNGIGTIDASGNFERINTNDFNNSIDKVLIDYQGNMWFTSSRLGLLRMAPSDFRDIYSTAGMDSRVVNTVAKWQGVYYIGTDKGLDAVDLAGRHRVRDELTDQLTGSRIRCMLVDTENHLWVCTYNKGLIEFTPEGETYEYNASNGGFGNRARVVTQLADGTILAAGDTGLSFIRDHRIEQNILYANGQIHSMVLTITELDDGRILAGTDGNGIAMIEDRKVTRMLTRADGLSSEVILRTVKDPKTGGVFVVTSNGLCYISLSPEMKIRTLDNFPYFNNYDIWIKGTDTLLVMSSAGIYVVDRNELLSGKRDLNYELLDTRRGLNSSLTANSWTYFNEATSELFLPCDNGVFVINTNRYSSGTKTYRMSVPTAKLDGVSTRVERNAPIRIGRGVSKLELSPEIVNYTIQEPYVGYMLEGFDPHWNIIPQNSLGNITYTNLPSGNYTFRLAVFDKNQESILAERTYEIIKEKELHDSPWFIIYMLTVPMFTVGWVTWLLVRRRSERMERELAEANRQVEMGKQTVAAIARAVDAKDVRTGGHSQRVAEYSEMIARESGMDEKQCREIKWAAQLHDIGKIGVPDNILNKDSRLTDEEYAQMKSHTTLGAEILKDFTLLEHVTEGAEFHHERPDGRGYPKGLKGDEIPLYARIIGVADAFDAMTATRVYRKQMDFGYVLGELEKGRGTQFAAEYVDILLKLIRTNKIDVQKLYGIDPGQADMERKKNPPQETTPAGSQGKGA